MSLLVVAPLGGAGHGGQQVMVLPSGSVFVNGVPVQNATGTGLMVGRVVDGSTGKPIEGASVIANMSPSSRSLQSMGPAAPRYQSAQVVTGADGRFVFRSLPAGDFMLRASLAGYLSGIGDGATRPGGGGRPVTLGDGEKVNDVVLRLWRTSALSGQVFDEQGEALEGIGISLVKVETLGARRRFTIQQTTTTDDRGAYRFANVVPGDYVSCALFARRIAPIAAGQAMSSGAGASDMQRWAQGSGAPGVSGSGYRIDDLMLISSIANRNVDPAPDDHGRFFVFGDACYAGASVVQAALPVTMESGQEKSAVNLTLRLLPTVKIRGSVTGPSGRIAGIGVHLFAAAAGDVILDQSIEAASTLTDPSGAFGFIGVPSGSYVLKVTYAPRGSPYGSMPPEVINQLVATGQISLPPPQPATSEPSLWATLPVAVADTDVIDAAMVLREGVKVSGRVVYAGNTDRLGPYPYVGVMTSLEPATGPALPFYMSSPARTGADGTFQTPGAVPGSYLIRVAGAPPGWQVKSIAANGRDASVDPLDITGDVTGVIVTLTDHPSMLTGVVRDENGSPDGAADVIVFPADRSRWSDLGAESRYVASARTAKTGTYSVINLPAGEYFVVAVDGRLDLKPADPKTLADLAPLALRVAVSDGDQRSQDLKLSPFHMVR